MKKFVLLFIQSVILFTLSAQEVRYTSANLNLRSAPNTSSEVIAILPRGTTVTIAEDCDCQWIPVEYSGRTGYVSSKYLTKQKVSYSKPSRRGPSGYYINSAGERVQSPTYYESQPEGATALCRDGTYSFSQNRRGTCSHHGGVARWLK